MRHSVIAGYVRTPFQFARKGRLAGVRPDDLLAAAITALVDRTGIDPAEIDDVVAGCAYPEAEQGNNIARIASLLAGLPQSVPGMTLNRFCGSSMSAIHHAAGQIAIGAGEAFICAGVESMSRVPQLGFSHTPNPRFRGHEQPDAEFMTEMYIPMGHTAENVAARYGIARADQDAFACATHHKAAFAQASGLLSGEIVAVETPGGVVEVDGCIRVTTTLAALAALPPAFDPAGSVTAGSASPLTDGAAATLICSDDYAERRGLRVFARIRACAVAGVAPELMGMGPVPAARMALARAGITIADLDVIELNEAFASQALACIRALGLPMERVNIDGGAIALGHPLGATGARITGKAAQILARVSGRYALAAQCIGGGQGIATVLERA